MFKMDFLKKKNYHVAIEKWLMKNSISSIFKIFLYVLVVRNTYFFQCDGIGGFLLLIMHTGSLNWRDFVSICIKMLISNVFLLGDYWRCKLNGKHTTLDFFLVFFTYFLKLEVLCILLVLYMIAQHEVVNIYCICEMDRK